jgi:hypothetical protein
MFSPTMFFFFVQTIYTDITSCAVRDILLCWKVVARMYSRIPMPVVAFSKNHKVRGCTLPQAHNIVCYVHECKRINECC